MSRSPLALSVLRYSGLGGSLLLALASVAVRHRLTALPLWFAGTVVLAGAWLLLGRRLTGVPLRWLLVTGVLWALPVLLCPPLESKDVYAYACQGSLVNAGIDPYTHGVSALPCPWLAQISPMWRPTPSPYGPLWLLISGGAASTGSLTAAVWVFRLVALVGIGLVGWAGHRVAVALGADPVRAAWFVLLSPLVLIHAVSGAHNDALMAGLMMAALAVAMPGALPGERYPQRALGSGALIGLALAVKATSLVLLPFAVLLLVRDRRWWPILRTGLLATVGGAVSYGALWALTGYGFGWVNALRNSTPLIVESTSIPTGIGLVAAHGLKLAGRPDVGAGVIALVRTVGLALLAAAVTGLWLWAWRRPEPRRVMLATALAVTAEILLGPVVFPWYAVSALAVLGYGLVDDRIRYRLGFLVAPAALLILPSGNGLAAIYRRQGGVLDLLLVLAALGYGLWYLRRRRSARRSAAPEPEPASRS